MKDAATALDVEAVRVTFALEAEEWLVEQFADLKYGKAYLRRFLDYLEKNPLAVTAAEEPLRLGGRLLTGAEREALLDHLHEVRKGRSGGAADRMDGKPRNVLGVPRSELPVPVSPTHPGPMVPGPSGPMPGPGR